MLLLLQEDQIKDLEKCLVNSVKKDQVVKKSAASEAFNTINRVIPH